MKNILLILLISFFGCSKNKENDTSMIIETGVDLIYKNANGLNLLNPTTLGYFKHEDIKLYYIHNGVKEEVYDSLFSLPRNLCVFTDDNQFILRIFTEVDLEAYQSITDDEIFGESTCLLELNEEYTDTIKTSWKSGSYGDFVTKVWFNGELKWELPHKTIIEVIKEK